MSRNRFIPAVACISVALIATLAILSGDKATSKVHARKDVSAGLTAPVGREHAKAMPTIVELAPVYITSERGHSFTRKPAAPKQKACHTRDLVYSHSHYRNESTQIVGDGSVKICN